MNDDSLSHVSVLVRVENEGRLRFQGTCFPYLHSSWWLTAGHCVDDSLGGDLGLAAPQAKPVLLDKAADVYRHPYLDLALVRSERALGSPFHDSSRARPGTDVTVVGYPEDLFLDMRGRDRPRLRILKGHIQRIETLEAEANAEGDLELSFPCPGGLSGSPVMIQGTSQVVGVVVGNRESFVTTAMTEVQTGPGGVSHTHETQRAVSLGSAVELARAAEWAESVIGGKTGA